MSMQLPETDAVPLSGPLYDTAGEHECTPETPSSPENSTRTAWLYQPLLSGPRSTPARTVGGDPSFLTLTVVVVDPSAFDAVHDTGVPEVSLEIVVPGQPG
jgi:hypothetical protein